MKHSLFFLSTIVAVALVSASCSDDDNTADTPVEFEVTPAAASMTFEAGQSRELDFTVNYKGSGALDFEVEAPEQWQCLISKFVRGEEGYEGRAEITAPDVSSEGRVRIRVFSAEWSAETSVAVTSLVDSGVTLKLPDTLDDFFTGRTGSFVFTVEGRGEGLTAEAAASSSEWKVRVDNFNPTGDESYAGSVVVETPQRVSQCTLTVRILDGDKQVVAQKEVEARCVEPDDKVTLTLAAKSCSLILSAQGSIAFDVTGGGAHDLTAEVSSSSADWSVWVGSFEADDKGYTGEVVMQAPDVNSATAVTLSLYNAAGEKVASADIAATCSLMTLVFEQTSYNFSVAGTRDINYTVTGGGTLKSAIGVPGNWRLVASSAGFTPNADGTGYTGTFQLQAPYIADDGMCSVTITDESGNASQFSVAVSCGGGTAVPVSKRGANCIVVSQAGHVEFDAVKGDGTVVTGSGVKWIWSDVDSPIAAGSLEYSAGRISFDTTPTLTKGNMLVALVDNAGNIVWSWHIWFVDGLNLDAEPGTFMNMNLGAVSCDMANSTYEDFGLFYQWGRKEPFPGPADRSGDSESADEAFVKYTLPTYLNDGYAWSCANVAMTSHADAARRPTEMAMLSSQLPSAGQIVWSEESDPCPKGWRLPTHKELTEHFGVTSGTAGNTGCQQSYGYGVIPPAYPDEWWPAPGCRMGAGGISDWNGALRLNVYCGKYWSSSSIAKEVSSDSEDTYTESGYLWAAVLSWSGRYQLGLSTSWSKSTASSVRCIKE